MCACVRVNAAVCDVYACFICVCACVQARACGCVGGCDGGWVGCAMDSCSGMFCFTSLAPSICRLPPLLSHHCCKLCCGWQKYGELIHSWCEPGYTPLWPFHHILRMANPYVLNAVNYPHDDYFPAPVPRLRCPPPPPMASSQLGAN